MPDGVSTSADPLAGQVLLGRFQVTGVSARAADAIRYNGIDTKTQKPVRIQRPNTGKLTPDQVAKVKDVGSAMLRLKAIPGVLGPLDGGIHAGVPFLVFPPLPGGTLAERLRHHLQLGGGAPTARAIRQWLKAVATTLDEAHAIGVCHDRLNADCIVVASDGSVQVDGLPLSQLMRAVGLGADTTPASDQRALATVVAEALGRRPRAVEKAVAEQPEQRYPTCAAFASDLLAELESSVSGLAGTGISRSAGEAPLELADPELVPGTADSGTPGQLAAQSFQLELENIDGDSTKRKAKKTSEVDDGMDLGDITFTKPGQALLTPKTSYQKATDLGGTRAAWRRMSGGFKGLPAGKQLIAKAVVACVGLLVAVWVVRAGWRAADWLVRSGRSVVQDAMEKVQPNVGKLRESGEGFAARMRGMWEEVVVADGETGEDSIGTTGSVVVGDAAPSRIEGDAWPTRPQDALTVEVLKEPTAFIQEVGRHKGAFTNDGLGVFFVDDPKFADQQSWIGGFGLMRKKTSSKPLLHGTLVHNADAGDVYVARFKVGRIRDFWCVERSPAKKNFVVYATLITKDDSLVRDGSAFVISPDRKECLALVYQDGEPVGAQWCEKKKNDAGEEFFEPPTGRTDIETMKSKDGRFTDFVTRLDEAVVAMPAIQQEAEAELRAYVRKKKLK